MKLGQIIRLYIPHFAKERFYLVYKITNKDYILLNITGKKKLESIDPIIPQYELSFKLPSHDNGSFVNLNNFVLIEGKFFFELFCRVEQPKETIHLFEQEFEAINKKIDYWFNNQALSGNLYRCRVLPDHDEKTLMIIS